MHMPSEPSCVAHPCSNFRGSRSWLLMSLGVGSGALVPAPHSSVAVRHRERRDDARVQGLRGINGRGPRGPQRQRRPAREGRRLCRERPLRQGARRYGSHGWRPTKTGQRRRTDEGRGRARQCAADLPRPRGAPIRGRRHRPPVGRHACPWDASKRLEKPWAGHAQTRRVQLDLSTEAAHNLSTACGSIVGGRLAMCHRREGEP